MNFKNLLLPKFKAPSFNLLLLPTAIYWTKDNKPVVTGILHERLDFYLKNRIFEA